MSDERDKADVEGTERVTDKVGTDELEDFEAHKVDIERVSDGGVEVDRVVDVDRVGTDSDDDDFEAQKLTTDRWVDKVSDV